MSDSTKRGIQQLAEQPADRLQGRHAVWIIEWAMAACAKRIEALENEVARGVAVGWNTPSYSRLGDTTAMKAERRSLADIKAKMAEFADIFAVLSDMQRAAQQRHNEAFVEGMREMWKRRS